jgi:non-heme chloroperoxidase
MLQQAGGVTGRLEILEAAPPQPSAAPPLLFVHGAFAGAWCWAEHFLPYFAAAGYRAYAVSVRGHGASKGREHLLMHAISDYVEDVAETVDHIGEAPILVGHSMGGFVIQKYLEQERVPAAVLMAPVPPQGLLPSQLNLAFGNPHLFAEMNAVMSSGRASPDAMRKALFAGPVDVERMRDYYHRTQPESQRAIWDMTLFSLPRVWQMSKPPMVLLAAERDALFPLEQMRIAANTLGCPMEVFPGMGHAMMLEAAWQKAADYIIGWLRSNGY